jgi:hypothetical protein
MHDDQLPPLRYRILGYDSSLWGYITIRFGVMSHMSSFTAVVDDRDPGGRIRYSGGWDLTSGAFEEFNVTASLPLTPHCNALLRFTGGYPISFLALYFLIALALGTGIAVYSTFAERNGTAQYQFLIDGINVGSFGIVNVTVPNEVTTRHLEIFKSSPLDDGLHTLEIVFNSAVAKGTPSIFLDYILYNISSPFDPNFPNTTLFYDDHSPYIQYDAGWHSVDPNTPSTSGASSNMLNTSTASNGQGSNFVFDFQGMSSIHHYN